MSEAINETNEQENEITLSAEIDQLLDQGYSQRQIKEMGYSPSLIRQRIRKRAKRMGAPPPEGKNDSADKAPVSLTIKEKEQVLPEWLEGQVAEIFDGSIQTQKAFTAGMAIPLLGMRMFSEAMRPIGELMKLWQGAQAEVARQNQQVGAQIAEETVNQVLPPVLDAVKQAAIAQSPNPMQSMMVRMMEPLLTRLFSSFTGRAATSESGLPTGWKDFRS